ncbi:RagB/SusD family nutrient uptake outer membrane protein [Arcticibacter sp.]|uniref:RagB/SusD family nutrient uptake outer membrane protein n=1 Tax=Arcticibacter sp. TaxID=1872630 RepID=UPI00388D80F1
MKKKIIYGILLIVGICSSSCNKWLELKPQDGITSEDFWKTKEQAEAAVIGIYSSLLEDPLVNNLFVWGELRADMVAPFTRTSIDEQFMMGGNILPTNGYTNWSSLYRTINYCNTVIKFAPQVLENDPTLNQATLDAYLAEAHAIRGLMYFYLLRVFGEVPLKTLPTSSDKDIERIAKSTKQEVHDLIISDLDFADKHAFVTYGSVDKDKGRVTRYTVNAIQADAYLWMEDYQNCLVATDKIISSGNFGLITTEQQSQLFNTLFYRGNSNESIFEVQFDRQKLNPFYDMFGATNRRFNANAIVMDEMYTIDVTNVNSYDFRAEGTSVRSSLNMIWKYVGTNGGQSDLEARPTDDYVGHWFVYRYADILLMKAEALTWLDRGAEALPLIKTVRDRAHALVATEQYPDVDDKEGISEYILAERAREFSFEGKRWFDVLRHAKRNNYSTSAFNYLLDVVTVNAAGNNQQSVRNKYRDVNSHYMPINSDEITRGGGLLTQNPFYQ